VVGVESAAQDLVGTPLLSSRARPGLLARVGQELAVGQVGKSSFRAAQRFLVTLTLRAFAQVVPSRARRS
jgi:hypothetical protein